MVETADDLPEDVAQARQRLSVAKEYLRTGDFTAAQDACRELLAENTEYVEALSTFGRAYMAAGNPESALPCFVRASMLNPDNPKVFVELAEVYCELEADEAAIQAAYEALYLDPGGKFSVKAHFLLGRLYKRDSDYASAVEHLEKVPASDPLSGFAALLSGACSMELGEPKKATKEYESVLKSDMFPPMDHVQILYELSQRPKLDEAGKILADIDALEREAPSFDDDLQVASFTGLINMARASLFECLGEYKDSWNSLEKGNAPLNTAYANAAQATRQQNPKIISLAHDWDYAGPAARLDGNLNIPLSLLILGPSRAGKTTLERLVASIQGVKRGHESEIVKKSAVRTSMDTGILMMSFPGQLPSTIHGAFSKAYAEEITARAGEIQCYTITHPGLITDLGCIAETVPNMKVVFIEREVDDTALRIFGKYYQEGTNPFAYNLARIYEYIEGYGELVDTWASKLPGVSMHISYEDMIADPKNELEKIADFCGLPRPMGVLPELGDDRGCAKPYLDMLKKARAGSSPEQLGGRWVSPFT